MAKRDPSKNPNGGDVLELDGERYAVLRIFDSEDGTRIQFRQGRQAPRNWALSTWRNKMRKARVIITS